MTALALQATDINFGRSPSAFIETMDSVSAAAQLQPRITTFEIRDIPNASEITENVEIFSKAVPTPLKVGYWSFAILSIFFLFQFILTFFGASLLTGFSGLVGFVGFGGLFKVAQRIHNEIQQKGYIQ